MHSRRMGRGLGVAAVLLASTGLSGTSDAGAMPQRVAPQSIFEPNVGAIAAFAPDDAWEVGVNWLPHQHSTTLAKHWDGTTWATVPTVNPGAQENELRAVSGTSTDDVWAVGYYWNGNGGPEKLLAEHWDGTAWSQVHVEQFHWGNHVHYFGRLYDVDAIAPDDVWAVGFSLEEGVTFTEHWDGTAWHLVPTPQGGQQLLSVSAAARDDVWIVGEDTSDRVLSLHWDGTSWTRVPVPGGHLLFDVIALSADDAWATGEYNNGDPVFLHWNGVRWHQAHEPRGAGPTAVWVTFSATSPTDIWASGTGVQGSSDSSMAHWDGTGWRVVPLPRRLATSVVIDVSADAENDAWLLGRILRGSEYDDVVGHWNGTRWRTQR